MPARRSRNTKALADTLRRDREPKRDPARRLTEPPPSPRHLSPGARTQWRRLAPAAVALGTMSAADLVAFALLCETLATAEAARVVVEAAGFCATTAAGDAKSHPAIKVMETARSQARGLLEGFGLVPRARGSMDVRPPGPDTSEANNPYAEFA